MDKLPSKLLHELGHQLDDDLARLSFFRSTVVVAKKENTVGRQRHLEFIKYLVSVATHPIGLRASVAPFNSSQEHMLAYIMDMFSLTDTKLKKMLLGAGNKSDKEPITIERQQVGVSPKKRHSWRPELRIRLSPPIFFHKERIYLDNLHVRVYLFKEESSADLAKFDVGNDKFDPEDTKSRSILNKIFKRFKLDSSVLIRPVKEMRHMIKFEPNVFSQNSKLSRLDYQMVQILNDSTKLKDDLRLRLRRYYCDPKSVHTLRFEFWLDTTNFRTGCLNWYKRLVRKIIYHGCYSNCMKNTSTHLNENQEFYGYINIKLTQLPSYATKQNYPILSLKERKVNNCQICLEPKNRRILEGDGKILIREEDGAFSRKSNESYLINHVRLYVNCLLYQTRSLNLLSNNESASNDDREAFGNVTLDNLFYIPAYTLINQHRLQSNLNHLEDKCLRRVSILLLLVKLGELQQFKSSKRNVRVNQMKILLFSVIQNEYMVADRAIDDKTLQEVDPFKDDTDDSGTRNAVIGIEVASLQKFVNKFLFDRLKKWLLSTKMDPLNTDRLITLSSLKMFKTAISHFKKLNLSTSLAVKIRQDASALKSQVEQLLCGLIINHLRVCLDRLIMNSADMLPVKNERVRIRHVEKQKLRVNNSLWLELLREIKRINHDLSLHWSRKGLNGLITNEQEFVKNLRMFECLEKQNFKGLVRAKMDDYLG